MADRVFSKLAQWTSLSDERPREGDRRLRRGRAGPARPRLRAAIVRAHDRDARRPQDSDAARLRRAAAAGSFPSRPTSRPISRFSTNAKRSGCCSRRATRRSPSSSASSESAGALDLVAREVGRRQIRRASDGGAQPRRDRSAPMTTRWPTPPRCALRSVLRRARRSQASRPRCSAATSGACGARHGRKPSRPARSRTGILPTNLRAANEDGARQVRVQALLDAFFTGRTARASPAEARTADVTTNGLCERFPALEDDLRREQDRLDRLARAQARGADARAQRRLVRGRTSRSWRPSRG